MKRQRIAVALVTVALLLGPFAATVFAGTQKWGPGTVRVSLFESSDFSDGNDVLNASADMLDLSTLSHTPAGNCKRAGDIIGSGTTWNDCISKVLVYPGYKLCIYADRNGVGWLGTMYGPGTFVLTGMQNDSVSSFRIRTTNGTGC